MSPPKLLPAVLGGLFLGVLSALPIIGAANACCCLWVVVGGALAAWVMQQNHPAPVTLADGAVVGLMAGAVGAVVMMVVSVPIGYLTGGNQAFSNAMVPAEGLTPEMREVLARIGPGVIVAVAAIMWLGASLVFSTLGGLIGAAFFKRPAPPAAPPLPPSTPSLPPAPAWGGPPPPPAPMVPPPDLPPPDVPAPGGPAPADRPTSPDDASGPDGPFERPISGEPDPDRRG